MKVNGTTLFVCTMDIDGGMNNEKIHLFRRI